MFKIKYKRSNTRTVLDFAKIPNGLFFEIGERPKRLYLKLNDAWFYNINTQSLIMLEDHHFKNCALLVLKAKLIVYD